MDDQKVQAWAKEKLEVVNKCPICKSTNKSELQNDLVDWFACPPTGPWKMSRCSDCSVAYLASRPTEASIKDAYSHYYTHTHEKDDLVNTSLRSVKDSISEKYYSAVSKSGRLSDYLVYLMARMFYPMAAYFDAKSRHIFDVTKSPGRLLDIGCGNGEFLRFADRFGWHVVGIDFDEGAITAAKSDGLDVRVGGVEILGEDEKFDFISLSHVIEHVYDPVVLLETCRSLLNEGGVLWLETPNVDSVGRDLYRSSWRGFEPPRHVLLFNNTSLRSLLSRLGYASVEQKMHGFSGLYMGLVSERLLNKDCPRNSHVGRVMRVSAKIMRVVLLELSQSFCRKHREFLTFVVYK